MRTLLVCGSRSLFLIWLFFCKPICSFAQLPFLDAISFRPWATNIARMMEVRFICADVNQDGRTDLLLHGRTNTALTYRTFILTNRGDASFGRFASLEGNNTSLAVGDWSNDGCLDLF